MKRTQQAARIDAREPWQIAQGAACGCRGADDMCPCQNVEGRPVSDLVQRLRDVAACARGALYADEHARLDALKAIIRIAGEKAQ